MSIRSLAAVAAVITVAGSATAGQLYFNGFETDTAGWSGATRVASGTNGVTSLTGGFHGTAAATAHTTYGGYNYNTGSGPVPFQNYTTSIAFFLNVDAGLANDRRFDFTSAINNQASPTALHLQDFAFNGGFYSSADTGGPGAGTNRFIFSASNNTGRANAFPKNSARNPIAIATTGWYTLTHQFTDNAGQLLVTMSITDTLNNILGTWTFGGTHNIANVGGNRYGWIAQNEIAGLAFDNSELTLDNVIPLPTTGGMATLGLLALGARRRRTR